MLQPAIELVLSQRGEAWGIMKGDWNKGIGSHDASQASVAKLGAKMCVTRHSHIPS